MTQPTTWHQIARILKTKRHHDNLTQTDIAAKTGVAPSTIGHWENGTRTPPANHLAAWCQALGYRLSLIRETEPPISNGGTQ